jgi:ribokinase
MYTIFGGAVLHKEDLDSARPLFEQASREDGMLIITVSCPIEIIHYAMELADHYGIKVLCDPGGITPEMGRTAFLDRRIFLIKPNEYEAELLTGVAVVNSKTAEQAARILQGQGCENVLITVGAEGAYLFTKDGSTRHILVPLITDEGQKNEVGCGDQVMATLCALLGEGYDLEEAANQAVTAGTLQFHKETVSPVTRDELMAVNS